VRRAPRRQSRGAGAQRVHRRRRRTASGGAHQPARHRGHEGCHGHRHRDAASRAESADALAAQARARARRHRLVPVVPESAGAGRPSSPARGGGARMTRQWTPGSPDAAVTAIARTPVLLVALDFDGTAAPLVPEPMSARALPAVTDAVVRLAALPDTFVAYV